MQNGVRRSAMRSCSVGVSFVQGLAQRAEGRAAIMLHRDLGTPAKSSEEKNTSGPEELNDLKRMFEGVKI